MRQARSGCPCTLVEPCSSNCTCRYPAKSGGCQRCARYGNDQQRKAQAERLAEQEAAAAAWYTLGAEDTTALVAENASLRRENEAAMKHLAETGALITELNARLDEVEKRMAEMRSPKSPGGVYKIHVGSTSSTGEYISFDANDVK